MVTNIILFAYIFFLLFCIGVIAKLLINRLSFLENSPSEHSALDHYVIFGFVILTAALAIISLFSKIGLTVHLIVFAVTFTGVIKYKEEFFKLFDGYAAYVKHNRVGFVFPLIVWPFFLLVLLYSASHVLIFDTGLYHAQYIQWIQTYKVVPGLFWIHSRFAFNSHFHLSCAFFNLSFLDIRNFSGGSIAFYPLSSFFLVLLLGRCTFSIYEAFKSKDNFAIVLHALLFILCFFYLAPGIQSPSPDGITSILIIYVLLIFNKLINQSGRSHRWSFDLVLVISIIFTLITFKLSAAMTVLFLPPLFLRSKLSLQTIALVSVMGIFFVVPFLIRNSIISGWLVYPLSQIDLFNFDWKAPIEELQNEAQTVKAWARLPAVSSEEVLRMPIQTWVPLWWKNINDGTAHNVLLLGIVVFNLVSPVLFLTLTFFPKNRGLLKGNSILLSVVLINLAFWFLNAPDPRFASGFLFFNTAFIIALALKSLENVLPPIAIVVGCFMLLLWFIEIPSGHRDYLFESSKRREIAIYPKQLEIPVLDYITNTQGKLIISRAPVDGRCFNVKIPCAPYPNSAVLLRGDSMEDGFTYPARSK